ncbi:MAG: hypothetical protein GC165_01250 [Armatimonadetes bacterium]|nr:hypothetical protein [Armatimonadota bacterium]
MIKVTRRRQIASITPTIEWQVQLFGEFQLVGADGVLRDLRSKKLESLLAVLLVSHPHGLSRGEITEIVWPETHSKQSLRQAVYSLRQVLGDKAIEATSDHCRLAQAFNVRSDYHDKALRSSETFMPGHTGEWYERVRTEIEVEGREAAEEATDSLSHSLMWLAQNDVRGFYAMLRSSSALVHAISFPVLRRLFETAARTSPELHGWSFFWRGTAEENLMTSARLLRRALDEAQRWSDQELASEVTFELGKVYARLGRPRQAMCVAAISDAVAQGTENRKMLAHKFRLKGTVLTYFGQSEKGIRLLEKGEEYFDDTLSLAHARCSRAFFLASVGRLDEAVSVLDWPQRVTSGLGHRRIFHLVDMTTAIAGAGSGDLGSAVCKLQTIVGESLATGFTQFGVCAADMLDEFYSQSGEPERALQMAVAAKQGRELSLAVPTPLDLQRRQLVRSC